MMTIIIVCHPGSITAGSSLPTLINTGVVINPVNPPLLPLSIAILHGLLQLPESSKWFSRRRIQMFICPRRPLVSEHGWSPADTEPSALIFEKGKSKSNTRESGRRFKAREAAISCGFFLRGSGAGAHFLRGSGSPKSRPVMVALIRRTVLSAIEWFVRPSRSWMPAETKVPTVEWSSF